MALLIQNQASLLARVSETDRAHAEFEREFLQLKRQSDERYAEIVRVLNEHSRLLERLPEAVREKIGFRPQQ